MNHSRTLVVLLVSLFVFYSLVATGCDSKSRGEEQTPGTSDQDDEPASSIDESAPSEAAAPARADLARFTEDIEGDGALHAVIETSLGDIRCRLYPERAPITVANFVGLARGKKVWRNPETDEIETDKPYYDSVIFHRVIPNFMIQTGDRTGTGSGGPGYTIPDEFDPSLRHDEPGVLSMANKGQPESGGSQFFILETSAPHLDDRHSVFGQCDDLDVVRKIARVPTGPDNRPKDPPVIDTITFEREPIDGSQGSGDTEESKTDDRPTESAK